jgi:hypothetical protein
VEDQPIESDRVAGKVEAIYELREAVERKVHAEMTLHREGSLQARDALLDATLVVEAKTQDAIETCHECGRVHASDEPHERRGRVGERSDNVVDVDFRPTRESRG